MSSSRTLRNTINLINRRIDEELPLVVPEKLLGELPLSEDAAQTVLRGRRAAVDILNKADDRLLVIVGPCSLHDPAAALEYAQHLVGAARRHEHDLAILMRAYPEKPRTLLDWRGLITDPHLDGSSDVNAGLRLTRRLLLDILSLGLAVGCEFLDPIIPQYISDTVSWGAIGARTVESQIHRQLASGLSMPVGFKNRRDGDTLVALEAVRVAQGSQAFPGMSMKGKPTILYTDGNPDCHVVLRGGRRGGKGSPNFSAPHVQHLASQLRKLGLPERVIIDISHENSGKDHEQQPLVASDVAHQIAVGDNVIVGVMLESFLVAGRQDIQASPLTYGQSVTDACISWETTESVLEELAGAVRARRLAQGV